MWTMEILTYLLFFFLTTAEASVVWTHNEFDPVYFRNGMHSPVTDEDVNGSATVVPDPNGGSNLVLKVFYEKGRYSHHGPNSKVQFFATPIKPRVAMTLSYDVRFDPNFDFRIGGKLPGLYGGLVNCSGGRHSENCFSTRFMWRENGDGEVYGYVPDPSHQLPGFCTKNVCNPVKGFSFGRGSWRFQRGVWQNIAQSIQLNTPGSTDGAIKVLHNGKVVYADDNLALRSQSDVNIDGIFFSTFFGGSNATWAPFRDCYAWFKNFAISFDTGPEVAVG
ncbi:uncharacterized protein LOC124151578 [Haliotis rufescens]|uniref:uncharacterized protein LOC124151578 n=1 Tax=Haliotis rufescens TaxID=6454 RepID=UPI00201EFC77|nr:uncharacterized protein LOC124151578 [Haliotis rufescens]